VLIRAHIVELELAETFAITRGATDVSRVVQVEVEHDGVSGLGEGAPVSYRGETAESALAFAEDEAPLLVGDDPFAVVAVRERLAGRTGEQAAKCAIDAALHDWVGRRLGQPTWRLLGLDRDVPPTSYTIGIDDLEGTVDRARRAARYPALKLKTGLDDDLSRLEAVRSASDAPIRIDCNEGWTLERARELMPELGRLGIELIEQPFPTQDADAYRALAEIAPRPPVFLDEGVQTLADVARAAELADGINIKLAKAGGIQEALRMVGAARALGLEVMIGCMVESQLGIAAAAQISSLADYADLDGHLLLSSSPYEGLRLENGRVLSSTRPGLGVHPARSPLR
jgi:L-alanine-DL-glutamate epimerase-like enolase superfamily enzyme